MLTLKTIYNQNMQDYDDVSKDVICCTLQKSIIDNAKDNSIKTVKPATRGQAITDHSYCKSHR